MSASKAKILVVEDDPSVLQVICAMLEAVGYEVTCVADGFEALLHLQAQVPDLILSDLNMPQMSGFELLSVVRRRFPKVLLVATSGAYDSRAVPVGVIADAFYPKGQESAGNLLTVIAELLQRGPIAHDASTAPVWIPRNGKDHNGKPYVVLTCTQCLRSFPFSVTHEPTAEILKTPCIYCPHEIVYIIDFSRSVTSPQKRAEWKAAFLETSQPASPARSRKSDAATLADLKKIDMNQPRVAKSAREA